MSLSHGEMLLDLFQRQDAVDAKRPWLTKVVGWRVSAQTYQNLTEISSAFDPREPKVPPMFTWRIERDPLMPEGHAVPFDKDGNALTVLGPRRERAKP